MQWFKPGWLWGARRVNLTLIPTYSSLLFLFQRILQRRFQLFFASKGLFAAPADSRGTCAIPCNRVKKLFASGSVSSLLQHSQLLMGSERFPGLRPCLHQEVTAIWIGSWYFPSMVCLGDNVQLVFYDSMITPGDADDGLPELTAAAPSTSEPYIQYDIKTMDIAQSQRQLRLFQTHVNCHLHGENINFCPFQQINRDVFLKLV